MLFDSTPKIVTTGLGGTVPAWLTDAFHGHADVLFLVSVEDGLSLRDPSGETHAFTHPLTAVTLFVDMSADADAALFDRAAEHWTEAGLDAPQCVQVAGEAADLGQITGAIMTLQSGFMQAAARRNVDLLQQIAILREVTEDQNASFAQALDILQDDDGGAKLVYRSNPYGAGVELGGDDRLRQRLPISIHPRLIGGITCYVDAPADTVITLALWSEELQVHLGHHKYTVPAGSSALFLPITLQDGITPKLLDLSVENNGYDPVILHTALCESPDERAMSDAPEDFSLRLDLCGPTSAVARRLPLEAWRIQEAAQTETLEGFERKTPGFDDRNWLNVASRGRLLVHPIRNTTAVASLDAIPVAGELQGVKCTLQLREKSASVTYACISVTEAALAFDDQDDVHQFAAGETSEDFGEIARSEWVAVMPGMEQDVTLTWDGLDKRHRNLKLNLMTSTRGQPTSFANFWFKNLTFLHTS